MSAPQVEAPGTVTSGDRARGAGQNEPCNSDSGDARRKLFADLRAKLALAGGHSLLELADGSFVVTKWNLCRPLPDLRAVAAFARQVGAV